MLYIFFACKFNIPEYNIGYFKHIICGQKLNLINCAKYEISLLVLIVTIEVKQIFKKIFLLTLPSNLLIIHCTIIIEHSTISWHHITAHSFPFLLQLMVVIKRDGACICQNTAHTTFKDPPL